MKVHFTSITCRSCGGKMDPLDHHCRHCSALNPDQELARRFEHQLISPYWKQILYFIIGFGGLQILGLIVSVLATIVVNALHPEASAQEIDDILNSANVNLIVNAMVYIFLAAGLGTLIWRQWPEIFASFKKGIPYLAGFVGVIIIFAFEMLYNVGADAILRALGIRPQSNANQGGINAMMAVNPALGFIAFGFIGPFVEEVTYRCGLFGFLSRVSKAFAYIVGSLVFAFIHFSWSSIWNPAYPGALIVELVNLPPYIFAGIAFGFLYDRFGFSASYFAHTLNNLISLGISLIPSNG